VTQLLLTAVAAGNMRGVRGVCCLPAAQQLGSKVVAELLPVAVANSSLDSDTLCAEVLSTLPAAQQLSREQLVELLHMAVQGTRYSVGILCKLSSAQQLDRSIVAALISEVKHTMRAALAGITRRTIWSCDVF
jgi:hypothetical protein